MVHVYATLNCRNRWTRYFYTGRKMKDLEALSEKLRVDREIVIEHTCGETGRKTIETHYRKDDDLRRQT